MSSKDEEVLNFHLLRRVTLPSFVFGFPMTLALYWGVPLAFILIIFISLFFGDVGWQIIVACFVMMVIYGVWSFRFLRKKGDKWVSNLIYKHFRKVDKFKNNKVKIKRVTLYGN